MNQLPYLSLFLFGTSKKYLSDCLQSVLNQTRKDIEVIAVDDGSSDRSGQILEEYAAKDFRIKVIHQNNAGVSVARNAAYPLLRGQYTLFVDADDWFEPDLCEKAVAVADREHADMTFFFFSQAFGRHYKLEKHLKTRTFAESEKKILIEYVQPGIKLWRSSFLRDNNILFPEHIRQGEDEMVQWHALLLNPKTALLPERMYHYRYNPQSVTRIKSRTLHLEDFFILYRQVEQLLQQTGQDKSDWQTIYQEKRLRTMYFVYANVYQRDRRCILKRIQQELGKNERMFLKQPNSLSTVVKDFYATVDGSLRLKFVNSFRVIRRDIQQIFIRMTLTTLNCFWRIS